MVADPVSHNVYEVFASGEVGILKAKTADFNNAFVSRSTDAGMHLDAVFPWIAAQAGTVDVVYYGTTGANAAGAVWHVYLAQTTDNGGSFSQTVVNATSNHVGVMCTVGTGCAPGTRNLLDFFEVGIDPLNG